LTIRKARLDEFQTIIDIVKESTEGVEAKDFIPSEVISEKPFEEL